MNTRYQHLVDRLTAAVFSGPGTSSVQLRRSAGEIEPADFLREAMPDDLRRYLNQVRQHAYKVTDQDVTTLDLTDDTIFELTVATALSAALWRRKCALAALSEYRHAYPQA